MHCLQSTHPVVYEQLMSLEFCVQRLSNAFAQVAIDHAIEQTINRNSKTKAGIIGFSKNAGAVHQLFVNTHQRAEITESCWNMTEKSSGEVMKKRQEHEDEKGSRLKRDELAVEKVVSTLSSRKSPFQDCDDGELSNIASGVIAPSAVTAVRPFACL